MSLGGWKGDSSPFNHPPLTNTSQIKKGKKQENTVWTSFLSNAVSMKTLYTSGGFSLKFVPWKLISRPFPHSWQSGDVSSNQPKSMVLKKTLQGTNISHLERRKIILKSGFFYGICQFPGGYQDFPIQQKLVVIVVVRPLQNLAHFVSWGAFFSQHPKA